MAITDRTQWKTDEQLSKQEAEKTTEELDDLAKHIRVAVKNLNQTLADASDYGLEVIIQLIQKSNEKAKVTYDEYEIKRIYKKEHF